MSYIGNQPVLNTSEFREEFAVTSTQTVFNTSGFVTNTNSEFLELYRNGVLLSKDDYSLDSDAATITLNNAAVSGDIVVVTGRRDITKRQTELGEYIEEFNISNTTTSSVTFSYPLSNINTFVFLNGVKLAASDVTINSATRVISFTGGNLANGDVVTVVSRSAVLVSHDRVSHYSTVSDDVTVPTGQNVAFFGDTELAGTNNIYGSLVVAGGAANFSGTTDIHGTFNAVG